MKEENIKDSILFVIVLYNCELNQSRSYQSIINELSNRNKLFIYDNSLNVQVDIPNHIYYIHDSTNPGLGKAYNEAFKYALKNHYKWIFILDQDTELPTNFLEKYIESIKLYRNINLFAPKLMLKNTNKLYSPLKYFFKRGFKLNKINIGINSFKNKSVVNSGIMITTKAYGKIGGYNEKITLDFSDLVFIEKYKKIYNEFVVVDCICFQNVSFFDNDIKKVRQRYKTLISCANEISKESIFDRVQYYLVLLYTGLHRSISFRSIEFVKIFFKNANF